MSSSGRTWELWAYRYKGGKLRHIGRRPWVMMHQLPHPLIPVLVEEVLGDLYDAKITHYGWLAESNRFRHDLIPTMIQVRAQSSPTDPKRALMFLNMCFPGGLDAAIEHGDGTCVSLRITERQENL